MEAGAAARLDVARCDACANLIDQELMQGTRKGLPGRHTPGDFQLDRILISQAFEFVSIMNEHCALLGSYATRLSAEFTAIVESRRLSATNPQTWLGTTAY